MAPSLKRLPPLGLCTLIALAGGLLSGMVAVHGLRQNSYGPIQPPAPISREDGFGDSGYPDRGYAESGYVETSPPDSTLSERDLGYRWASLQAVRTPDECPNDSWGFRRGCLDFTGGV